MACKRSNLKSSHGKSYIKSKGVLKNFAKFKGKLLCRILFLIKLQAPVALLKERLLNRCLPMNFVKFLQTPFYITPPGDCFCNLNDVCTRNNGIKVLNSSSHL